MTDQISAWMRTRTGWRLDDDRLRKTFRFPDFVQAVTFVNRVADAAEDMDHHPDIDIRYSAVRLSLWTHTAGGVTEKDLALAEAVDLAID